MSRELENAGYDEWKLSNRDDEVYRVENLGIWNLGACPYCDDTVYSDELYIRIEEDNEFYHFACHNLKVKEESEE